MLLAVSKTWNIITHITLKRLFTVAGDSFVCVDVLGYNSASVVETCSSVLSNCLKLSISNHYNSFHFRNEIAGSLAAGFPHNRTKASGKDSRVTLWDIDCC